MRLNVKYLNDTERKAKKDLYPEKFDIIAKTYINRCNYHLINGYKTTAKRDYEKAVKAANDFGCIKTFILLIQDLKIKMLLIATMKS